jgi:phage recombination protein Bet
MIPNFTIEQLQLITDTVARNASPDELKLFLYRAKNMGLDPLKPGQIHFVKYNNGPGTIVVGIEGFRSIAHRSGKLSGISRGVVRGEKGEVIAAWAEVHRLDWTHPAREEVPFAEYNTGRGPWLKMPETMLKKVAEAAALRMAFPNELGGVYESAEMDQAERPVIGNNFVRPEQPMEGDGIPDNTYRIPFGKFKMRTLEQVGVDDLRAYVEYLEMKAEKDGKEITGLVADFIARAVEYIGGFENFIDPNS